MRIVVDRNIPFAEQAFGRLGEVRAVETGAVNPQILRDADALVIRSETRVDAKMLEGSPVRFVGTATIGTDHCDTRYLADHGISFASAPGCNATSVAEYMAAALLTLARRTRSALRGKTIGIVGVGNVGARVARLGEALGMTVLLNDPPLARSTGDSRFLPLDALMEADIISLHVPLTFDGPDPTFHFFDDARMAKMKPGAVLVNTSRGAAVDSGVLAAMIASRRLSAAILDVWEHEPAIDVSLMEKAFLATPHVAGYALDGKVNAVRMIYEALCRHLGSQPDWSPPGNLPPPRVAVLGIPPGAPGGEETLCSVVEQCYDIAFDDRKLKALGSLPEAGRRGYFRALRTGYPVRRQFIATTVRIPPEHEALSGTLLGLGFTVLPPS